MKKKIIYVLAFMAGVFFPALSGNLNQVSSVVQESRDTVRTHSLRSLTTFGNFPEVMPPSPQMAAFQTFMDIPVSYATGVPDVSIPLYTLKSGGIEIPIVLRYHTHNVKPHLALSTNVALGWTVEYGGSLSRTIVGAPDEILSPVDAAASYDESTLGGFSALYAAAVNNGIDLQSDWFHYSMPTGEGGRFFLERKSPSGTFADRYDCWLYPNTETRVDAAYDADDAFATFTLTDRYGLQCQYGNGYVEYPEAYYPTGGCSAWMLEKVTDPKTGRSVNYTYTGYSDIEAEELENTFTASVATLYDENPRSSLNSGVQMLNGWLHADQGICGHMYDSETVYLDNNCLGAKRRDYSMGTVKGYQSWKPVTISDGHTTVTFNYASSLDNRISSIVVTAGGTQIRRVDFICSADSDGVPLLDSISVKGRDSSAPQTYGFGYNSVWSSNAPDFWGFATGRTESPYSGCYTQRQTLSYLQMNGHIQGGYDFYVNGNPGQTDTTTLGTHDFSGTSSSTSCLLTRITYPTGGYSSLNYESGTYQDGITRTGGVPRVKYITDSPATGSPRTRTFTYQNGRTDLPPGALELYLNAGQQVTDGTAGRTISTVRSYGNTPHFGLDIDVYYPQVDVEHTDGTSSFREVYTYNTAQEHTYGTLFMLDQYQRYYVKDFFSNPLKGRLLKKQVYDGASGLKREEVYTYSRDVRHSIHNLLALCQIGGLLWGDYETIQNGAENSGFLKYPVFQYAYYTIKVPSSTLTGKTVTTYDGSTPVVTTENYTYADGSDVRLTRKVTSRSDGSTQSEDYTYVSSSSTNGPSLMDKNMVGLQETVTSTQGGQSESLKYGYTAAGLNDKVWYRQGSGNWQPRSTVEYGGYGNPLAAYGPDNMPVCYVWAYGGRHPLARIDGLSYSQYTEMKNTLLSSLSVTNNTALASTLSTLRNTCKAKGAHVTGRLYDNATGSVVRESLPSGEVVDYGYDGWGRLTTVKNDNARTVRTHAYSLGSNSNYILTKDMLDSAATASSDVKQWFDGLGRPLETVDMGAGTSGKNLITLTEYDRAGRTARQWLPYASTADYVAPSTLKSSISSADYGGDSRPYTEIQYEASTLGRTLKEYAPGDNWAGHPRTMEYLSNTASGLLACKAYGVSAAGALTGGSSNYAAGQLSVTKAADEGGKAVHTFTDKQGQKVLERAVDGSEYLDTYYVYDNYGNLCFVLQPEYQTTADLSKYAFQYKYDTLKRCTWKKLPGASGMTMEYDSADRMVFSQDGNGKWTWYEYDNLGRLTGQGENSTDAVTAAPYLQNYYDTYEDFIAVAGSGFTNDQSGNGYGYLTGTVQEVFGETTRIYTAYYYDNLGQVIKEVKNNLLGGYDTTVNTYTFTGKPATITHTHTASGKTTRTEVYTYTYDGKDRLTKVTHKLGTGAAVTLAEYTYDALGRQSTKKQGTDTSTYSYNIRNWLTGISSTKFTQTLGYGSDYNGNISSINWNANGSSHSYTFTYDGVNRMLNATHGTGAYTEKVTLYDKNGNIKGLQRYGGELIDNLTYTYSGNQLTRVDDATGNAAGFSNGASAANEYTYDNNGNLTKDSNKGITNITYNCLNLPSKVTFGDGSTIVYTYAADGTKLRTVHTISGTSTQKDYCANVVYENGVQKMLLTEEGYVDLSNSFYYYYLKDHQGNNRMVVSSGGTVAEVNHYYPFGGVFASTSNAQPYKYNGKEFDTKKGLNWYDYGARHYDATLGRWLVVDPLAEKDYSTSTYGYCLNNPIKYVDFTGMAASPIYDKEGNLLGTDDEGLQGDAIVMNKDDFKQGMSHEEALSKSTTISSVDAAAKMAVSYASLKFRPDYDGKLTLSEANEWYRNGNGQPLFVALDKINLNGIRSLGENYVGNVKSFNLLIHSKSLNDGLVYGQITLKRYPNHQVRAYSDKYNFEMHNWTNILNWGRNVETIIGERIAGNGKSYEINIYGSQTLRPILPWIK